MLAWITRRWLLALAAASLTVGRFVVPWAVTSVFAQQAGRIDPAQAAHMRAHFREVTEIHEAIIRGDLEAVRRPARWLAEHEGYDDMPPLGARYVGQLALRRRLRSS